MPIAFTAVRESRDNCRTPVPSLPQGHGSVRNQNAKTRPLSSPASPVKSRSDLQKITTLYIHGQMKREHDNMIQNTQIARLPFVQVKITSGLDTKTSWEMWLSKDTNNTPLLDVNQENFFFLILRALIHIFVFEFHLSMSHDCTAHNREEPTISNGGLCKQT